MASIARSHGSPGLYRQFRLFLAHVSYDSMASLVFSFTCVRRLVRHVHVGWLHRRLGFSPRSFFFVFIRFCFADFVLVPRRFVSIVFRYVFPPPFPSMLRWMCRRTFRFLLMGAAIVAAPTPRLNPTPPLSFPLKPCPSLSIPVHPSQTLSIPVHPSRCLSQTPSCLDLSQTNAIPLAPIPFTRPSASHPSWRAKACVGMLHGRWVPSASFATVLVARFVGPRHLQSDAQPHREGKMRTTKKLHFPWIHAANTPKEPIRCAVTCFQA